MPATNFLSEHTTDAFASERDLVVNDAGMANGLTRAGIPATTFSEIRRASDLSIMTRLAGESIVLVVDPRSVRKAWAVANRLDRLRLPFLVVRELFDRRGT